MVVSDKRQWRLEMFQRDRLWEGGLTSLLECYRCANVCGEKKNFSQAEEVTWVKCLRNTMQLSCVSAGSHLKNLDESLLK